MCKMRVLDKKWIEIATPISDRFWFSTIFIDMHELVINNLILNVYTLTKLSEKVQKRNKQTKFDINQRKNIIESNFNF
jgi:hypothetical protein